MVSIGLINPKSATNVASVLRACGCYGASAVFYTGQRYRYAKEFNADTKRVRDKIPIIGVDDIFEMTPKNAKTVVIELVEHAIPLPQFTHPDNAFYVFGPEDGTVPISVIKKADSVVYIPTYSSMNLAATANVVLYDRLAKSTYNDSSEFIRASRDNNNNSRL